MCASENCFDIGNAKTVVPPCIQKDMDISDVMVLCPAAEEIMAAYGLHCFSCSMGGMESIHDGCMLHGFDDETIDALVEDLNASVCAQQPKPSTIIFSKDAVQAIEDIAHREDMKQRDFVVAIDTTGDFSLEPRTEDSPEEQLCFCMQESALRIFASPLVLWRCGGSTVTYRDGRFILCDAIE